MENQDELQAATIPEEAPIQDSPNQNSARFVDGRTVRPQPPQDDSPSTACNSSTVSISTPGGVRLGAAEPPCFGQPAPGIAQVPSIRDYPIAATTTTSTIESHGEHNSACRGLPAHTDSLRSKAQDLPGDPPSGSNNQSTGPGGGDPNKPTGHAPTGRGGAGGNPAGGGVPPGGGPPNGNPPSGSSNPPPQRPPGGTPPQQSGGANPADIQEHHPIINLYLALSVQLIHGHPWTGQESHCRSSSFPPTTSRVASSTCSRCSKIGTTNRHLR